jgi:hypothetical protein
MLEHLGRAEWHWFQGVVAGKQPDLPGHLAPLGKHGPGGFEPPNVRWVVLHRIEETARHAGHLGIARELLDGTTRRGGR